MILRALEAVHSALWWVRLNVVFPLTPHRRDFVGPPWRRGEWHEQPLRRRVMLTLDQPLQALDCALVTAMWRREDVAKKHEELHGE